MPQRLYTIDDFVDEPEAPSPGGVYSLDDFVDEERDTVELDVDLPRTSLADLARDYVRDVRVGRGRYEGLVNEAAARAAGVAPPSRGWYTDAKGEDEPDFQRWYAKHAQRLGLDPNPDAPEHEYDYRIAFRAGAEPGPDGHWPSTFKRKGHPNLVVDGVDTRDDAPVPSWGKATGIGEGPPERTLLQQATEAPGRALRSVSAGVFGGVTGTAWGSLEWLGTSLGLDSVTEFARKYGEQAKEMTTEAVGSQEGMGFVEKAAYGGVQSIGQSAGPLLAGALTNNPAVTYSLMGLSTAAPAYQEATAKGVPHLQATAFAASQGLVEIATEKTPAIKLFADLTKGSGIGKTIMRQLVEEIPNEQLATFLQDLNEWATLNPEKPFQSYIDERPSAIAQTFIATVVATVGQSGSAAALQRMAGTPAEADAGGPAAPPPDQTAAATDPSDLTFTHTAPGQGPPPAPPAAPTAGPAAPIPGPPPAGPMPPGVPPPAPPPGPSLEAEFEQFKARYLEASARAAEGDEGADVEMARLAEQHPDWADQVEQEDLAALHERAAAATAPAPPPPPVVEPAPPVVEPEPEGPTDIFGNPLRPPPDPVALREQLQALGYADDAISGMSIPDMQEALREAAPPPTPSPAPPAPTLPLPSAPAAAAAPLSGVPENPQPGVRYEMAAADVEADPASLQFRQAVGAEGVEGERRITERYDPEKGGVIVVWKRPSDGRVFVINGHHRLAAAKRDGANVAVMFTEQDTAEEARAHGALLNLSEDHSSLPDAVQAIVDGKFTPARLAAAGVSERSKVAKQARAIANLAPNVLGQWRDGVIPDDIAAVIGAANLTPAQQTASASFYGKQAAQGRELSPGAMGIAVRRVVDAPTAKSQAGPGLFGDQEDDNLFAETVLLEDYVVRELRKDKRLFGGAARHAEKLAEGGTTVDVTQAETIAGDAARTEAILGKVMQYAGPAREAIKRAAVAIREGQNATAVRAQLLKDIRVAAEAELRPTQADRGGRGPSGGADQTHPAGAVPPGRHPPAPEVTPAAAGVPTAVVRHEEAGVAPSSVDKPHGLYTTPADVESPHADLGGERRELAVNPTANVLTLTDFGKDVVMRRDAVSAGAGVHAARHFLGAEAFRSMAGLPKPALVSRAKAIDPSVDWSKYYDTQEIMEGIGGVLARRAGHDALWLPDASDPRFSEFVGLTENAFTKPPSAVEPTSDRKQEIADKFAKVKADRLAERQAHAERFEREGYLYHRTESGTSYLLHRSLDDKSKYRVTSFEADGTPSGHREYQVLGTEPEAAGKSHLDHALHEFTGKTLSERPSRAASQPAPQPFTAESLEKTMDLTEEQAAMTMALFIDGVGLPFEEIEIVKGGTPGGDTLPQAKPVASLRGDELGAVPTAENAVELARAWYQAHLQSPQPVPTVAGPVRFSGKGFNKARGYMRRDRRRAQLLPAVRPVIEQGEYLGREPSRKTRRDKIVAFHRFSAPVELDGQPLVMEVVVAEDANGNLFYTFDYAAYSESAPVEPRDVARELAPPPGTKPPPSDTVAEPSIEIKPAPDTLHQGGGMFDEDVLDTGERQARLPGDVGAVREEERPTPQEPLPEQTITLTAEEAKRRQAHLFGAPPPKATKRKAKPVDPGQDVLFQMENADVWYWDNVVESLKTWPQTKGTPEQLLAHLKKTKGALEEADDIGLTDWLKGKKSVTKAEAEQFVSDNKIELVETNLGDLDSAAIERIARERYDEAIDREAEELERTWNETAGEQFDDYGHSWVGAEARFDDDEDAWEAVVGDDRTGDFYESKSEAEEAAQEQADRLNDDARDDYIREHRPDFLERAQRQVSTLASFEEDVRGEHEDEATQYDQYQLKGPKEGYREILLSLPRRQSTIDPAKLTITYQTLVDGRREAVVKYDGTHVEQYILATGETLDEARALQRAANVARTFLAGQDNFEQGHFENVPNLLVHVRVNIRTLADGRRVLFIEEIQSDWHQAGRKKGYAKTGDVAGFRGDRVPDAPFKGEAWKRLALKRMLAYAAEQGVDGIAWTTGVQQVGRYSDAMRKQVDRISWVEKEAPPPPVPVPGIPRGWGSVEPYGGIGGKQVRAEKDGAVVFSGTVKDGKFVNGPADGKDVADVLGKEVAAKIEGDVAGDLKGEGLTVGGEGMKGFYDRELPNLANDLAKRYGQKVGRGEVSVVDPTAPPRLWARPGENVYEGPQMTLEEVTNALQRAERDRMGVHVTDSLRRVAAAMKNRGMDFAEAMTLRATSQAAFYVGGKMTPKPTGVETVHVLATPAEMREAVEKYRLPLYQEKESLRRQGAKAAVAFSTSGKALVHALEKPDVSSAVHELAHIARRWLLNQNIKPEFRRGITDEDIATTAQWAGAKQVDGQWVWDRAAEEKFARGFERYLRDGASPSTPTKLHGVFQKMAEWLADIYTSVEGSPIDIDISPAMRLVFDRLVTRVERVKAEDAAKATGPPRAKGTQRRPYNAKPIKPVKPLAPGTQVIVASDMTTPRWTREATPAERAVIFTPGNVVGKDTVISYTPSSDELSWSVVVQRAGEPQRGHATNPRVVLPERVEAANKMPVKPTVYTAPGPPAAPKAAAPPKATPKPAAPPKPAEPETSDNDDFDSDLAEIRGGKDDVLYQDAPPSDEDLTYLGKNKLVVTIEGDKAYLTGKTYDNLAAIKAAGGYDYRADMKRWTIPLGGLTRLATALRGTAKTGTTASAIRKQAEARPNRSQLEHPISYYVGADTAKIITDGGLKIGMPQDVIDEQIEDVARIVRAHTDKIPAFLLASEPGSGKTFVLGGAMRELKKRGVKKITYVTLRQELITQIKDDLVHFDIADVANYITYPAMRKAPPKASEVLIFDEAHSAKNVAKGTKQAVEAGKWMELSNLTILASATPFENPAEMQYIGRTGLFKPFGGFIAYAKAYGAKTFKLDSGVEVPDWTRKPGSDVDAKAARQWLVNEGTFTSRRTRLPEEQVESRLTKLNVAEADAQRYAQLMEAASEAELSGFSGDWVVNFGKRLLEASKVDFAIKEAQNALDSGRFPIIFVETKAERKIDIPDLLEREQEWQMAREMARMQREAPPRRKEYGLPPLGIPQMLGRYMEISGESVILIPSAEDVVRDHFGADKVAIFTGSVSPTAAQKNLDAWRRGEKPIIIATMEKGGTGLSLHDKVGNHQTTQINVNMPWTATKVVQVTQRSARYGLKGKAEIMWLFADNVPFDRQLSKKVGGRMADMGAVIHGERLARSGEIEDWSFEDQPLSSMRRTVSMAELAAVAERKGTTVAEQVKRARKAGYYVPEAPRLVKPAAETKAADEPKTGPDALYQDADPAQGPLPMPPTADIVAAAAGKVAGRFPTRAAFDKEMIREFGAGIEASLPALYAQAKRRVATLKGFDIDDYFNFKRIDVSDEEKDKLRGMIAEVVLRTGRVPKERESWETIRAEAAEMGPEVVDALVPFQKMQAPFRAVRHVARQRINTLNEEIIGMRKALDGEADPQEILKRERVLAEKERDLQRLLDTWMRLRSEDGRNLAMHRMTVTSMAAWYQPAFWLSKARSELGLPPGVDLPIDVMRKLQNILDRGKAARETGDPEAPIQLDLARFMKGLRRSTLLEIIVALRKAGLLTGLKTQSRNFGGNILFAVMEELSRVPAVLVDMAVATATGHRTVHGLSPRAIARSGYHAAREGTQDAIEVMKHGSTADDMLRADARRELNSGYRWLDFYANVVFRTMSAVDRVFKSYAWRRSIEEQAVLEAINRGVSPIELLLRPTQEMLTRALSDAEFATTAREAAEFATFNNKNIGAEAYSRGMGYLRRHENPAGPAIAFGLDFVIPFTNTPANILARTFGYAGGLAIGPVRAAYNAARPTKKDINEVISRAMTPDQQRVFALAMGRGSVGAALMYLGWTLAAAGLATGLGDDDEGDRNVAEAAGRLSGGVRFGSTWRQVSAFPPMGTLIALGASMQRASQKGPGQAGAVAAKLILEQPMLKGVSDIVEALQRPTSAGESFVTQAVGSLVPSFLSDAAALYDPYRRDARAEGMRDSLWTGAAARVPGWRNTLPARQNVFGEKQAQTTRAIWDPTIATVARELTDRSLRELIRHDVGIGWPDKRPGESAADYRERVRIIGGEIKQGIARIVASPAYQSRTKAQQTEMLEDAVDTARRVARPKTTPPPRRRFQ